jgi:hypothetical protein
MSRESKYREYLLNFSNGVLLYDRFECISELKKVGLLLTDVNPLALAMDS